MWRGESGVEEESGEHESIKSIQLRHELQGSLSMSKPMKMTIHQERVLWQRWKSVQACTHTTYSITMDEKKLIPACLKLNVN